MSGEKLETANDFFFFPKNRFIININYKIQRKYYQATTKARQRTKSQIPYALQVDELHRDE